MFGRCCAACAETPTVWYAPDEVYLGSNGRLVDFFGVPAMTNIATPKLARLSGAAVLAYFCRRLPGDDSGTSSNSYPFADFPGNDAIADTRRLVAMLEDYLRLCPEQYLWLHKRFRNRPAGYPDLYAREPALMAKLDLATLRAVPRGIWALGIVSLLMDTSSELIHSLLPIYLVGTLGASMTLVGVIEGIAEATASVSKLFSGCNQRLARAAQDHGRDRIRARRADQARVRARDVGRLGLCGAVRRPRGQRIRGAPRDALIADLSPPGICAGRASACASRSIRSAPFSARSLRSRSCSCWPATFAASSRSPPCPPCWPCSCSSRSCASPRRPGAARAGEGAVATGGSARARRPLLEGRGDRRHLLARSLQRRVPDPRGRDRRASMPRSRPRCSCSSTSFTRPRPIRPACCPTTAGACAYSR